MGEPTNTSPAAGVWGHPAWVGSSVTAAWWRVVLYGSFRCDFRRHTRLIWTMSSPSTFPLPRVIATDFRTVGTGTAFAALGVSQALGRTELVPIRTVGNWVLRPNLLGAIVGKATASVVDTAEPERPRLDLAFLCGLAGDPFACRSSPQ